LVPPGVRGLPGDAVRVPRPDRVLEPPEPGRNVRFAVPAQPLDRVHAEPEADECRDRERARRARGAHPRVPARARPAAEHRRRGLLRRRRPGRDGARVQRATAAGERAHAGRRDATMSVARPASARLAVTFAVAAAVWTTAAHAAP